MGERMNFDDPNAELFGLCEEESEEEMENKQIYGKTPGRVSALNDLWYGEMISEIDGMDIPEEAKRKMIFSMTANGVLDMISDSVQIDSGLEVTFSFDMFLGVSLTNKRFKVDLFKEHHQALMTVKREEFPDDDAYEMALEEFEERWWDIPQPLLDKRTPNDAIRETLSKYGLTE